MKAKGQKANPNEVGQKIVANLNKTDLIEKVEISGPGFINVYLSKQFAKVELKKILSQGVKPPFAGLKKRAIVDFSSPNIAKEMHVGHLRYFIIYNLNFFIFFLILYSL